MAEQELLRPYLAGEPRDDGEQDMRCPLHHDTRRSATINFERGVWWCGAGCGGGSIKDLIAMHDRWVEAGATGSREDRTGATDVLPTPARVAAWSRNLIDDLTLYGILVGERGITGDTMQRWRIGWDPDQAAFTIPVFDEAGELVNVRYYDPNPDRTRRKIWQVRGAKSKMLYPMAVLAQDPGYVIICEGEWDALLTNQHGFPAITRTSSATTWFESWSPLFKDRVVYLAHDCDVTGQAANDKVGRSVERWATEVRVVQLPYGITEKHGKDLTDYWLDGHTAADFQRLLEESVVFGDPKLLPPEVAEATVSDAFDSGRLGEPLRMTVTVNGKREPGYSLPAEARLTCDREAGEKCSRCPLAATGDDVLVVDASDPVLLQMIGSTTKQTQDLLRCAYGAQKCDRLDIDVERHQAVEILFARPSVGHTSGPETHRAIKITSVGRHDTGTNLTVQVEGALHVDPRSQANEFLSWRCVPMQTSIDQFEPTPEELRLMRRFRPKPGQRPLKKLGEIARELSASVTKIYGRVEMHVLFDLVWHSVTAFRFDGEPLTRGWLEALVVGDTRTGKSEAAKRLAAHYGCGEVVDCESASLAGLVGGLQQFGGGREWAITWGVLPLQDRRLAVLDEVSGLQHSDIQAMSQMRSSGVAEINKVQQDRTMARTRKLWLGNPRESSMSRFTFGVDAIAPLIGNPEDIARFDLAMSLATSDVPADVINRPHMTGTGRYSAAACRAIVRWSWSRTVDQVEWAPGATEAVFRAAIDVGARYVPDPPLVLRADIRTKIARIAVAIAARLFSSTPDHECILVEPDHVAAAVTFLDRLYAMPGFGYATRSADRLADVEVAERESNEVENWLAGYPGLADFLRTNATFRVADLESFMSVTRDVASMIVNTLWKAKMVRRDAADVVAEPALHNIIRRIR